MVRLATVVVTFVTGIVPGVLAYLAGWILVPQEPLPIQYAAPAAQPSVEANGS